MKIHVALLSIALATAVVNTQAPALDDAAVGAAIRAGQAKKFDHLISDCLATPGFGEGLGAALAGGIQPTGNYRVVVSGAEGMIALEAAEAKRLYKPYDVTMVGPELRSASTIFVEALPVSPKREGNTFEVAAPIESVVLKSKVNKEAVAQAVDLELTPVEWKNLLGATFTGTSARAQFNMGDVKALPIGDFDVVLITSAGERRCKVGSKDRARILR